MKILKYFILFIILIAIILSCKKDNDLVPYQYVDFYIYLSDPTYSELNSYYYPVMIGNVGVLGIIMYRKSETEFIALERMCTYKTSDRCAVVPDSTGYFVECSCCSSKFNLTSDGYIENGPATRPLVQYLTSFDGQKIHVTN
ncbi:MAG: hypothetical protein ABIJ97_17795 [Bacteroidota bacterium]